MTERPEGAPGQPDEDSEPEIAPEPEPAPEQEPASEPEEAAADNADDAEDGETELEEELEDETVVPLGVEPAASLVAATGAPAVPRRRGPQPAVQRAPTPSELAVHVTDRVSNVFVIVTVVAFVAILLNGLLLGTGGFFTATSAPTPSPTVSVSPAPSASGSPSADPSESAEPSASPS